MIGKSLIGIRIAIVFILLLSLVSAATAGDYRGPMRFVPFYPCAGSGSFCGLSILAEGEIQPDSAESFEHFLAKNQSEGANFPESREVAFDSLGGSLLGAIKLGQIIRRHKLNTRLALSYIKASERGEVSFREDVQCSSACVFAIAGGRLRRIEDDARLGVHQFYRDVEPIGDSATQVTLVLLANHLEQMGIDRRLLDIAGLTPPTRITFLSPQNITALRLDNRNPPESLRWSLEAHKSGLIFASLRQWMPDTGQLVEFRIQKDATAYSLQVIVSPEQASAQSLDAARNALLREDVTISADFKELATYKSVIWSLHGETAISTRLLLTEEQLRVLSTAKIMFFGVHVTKPNQQLNPGGIVRLDGLKDLIGALKR